tara:strand:- start:1191 stop:1601 length:411 start_codon:yes stop_codon:yes gene_type:complete
MFGRRDCANFSAQELTPDLNINAAAISAKYGGKHNDDPRRAWTGSFSVPKGINMAMFEHIVDKQTQSFVASLAKRGWDIISRLQLRGPFPYRDLDTNLVLLDQNEYHVRGAFQLRKPKPVRIEIPSRPHERNLVMV